MPHEPTDPALHDNSVRIRDAACVVVYDDTSADPLLLMGRRRSDQIFLPDKWVFPGGRVDPGDLLSDVKATTSINDIASGLPAHIQPFARAGLRELKEETGLSLRSANEIKDVAPATFLPFARAITPPGRVRRYDTWFFVARRALFEDVVGSTDDELLDLGWFAVSEARRLDIPNITRLVLDDAATWMESGTNACPTEIPFYYQDGKGFQRTMLACDQSALPP